MWVCTPITIRCADTDMMGVVYHANYLLYFEDARAAFLEALGFARDYAEQAGFCSPLTQLECAYLRPLRYGEQAFVRTRVVSLRPARIVYEYEVYADGDEPGLCKPRCQGRSTHCVVDSRSFKPVKLQRALPELYGRYEEALEPEEGAQR